MSPLSGSLTSAPRRAISTRSALISFATGSVGRRSYDCLRRCRSSSSGRTFGRSASACDLVNVGICSRSSMGPGGSAVATYVLLTKVTAAGVKTLQANPRRIKEVNKEIETLGARVIAQYATLVPGLVDCHAHFTGLGGADWIARFQDDEAALLSRAADAARALVRAGVLATRDVGAPHHLNIRIRDEMRGRSDAPLIVAAGTWIARRDTYVPFAIQVDSAEQLQAAALAELDAGAEWVKLAVDTGGMKSPAATFSADELRPMVEAVHARGAKVPAHSQFAGADNAARAGIDSVEDGVRVDHRAARPIAHGTQ